MKLCWASLMLLLVLLVELGAEGYTIDPCGSLKCTEPEISCLLLIPETRSYECKCKKTCKSPSLIRGPFVRTKPSPKSTKVMRQVNDSAVTPAVKQYGNNQPVVTIAPGGSSCYPSACMNGGTCYSTPYPTTTTTTRSYTTIPVCSCQPQFTGSRCELYTPAPAPPSDGWNNLCRVYNERNMNICQNGGQCVFISDGKVACVCPSTYTGQFCELPVYVQCSGPYASQCHRDYGTCAADGSCRCMNGYCGPKCDIKTNNNYNPAPVTNPPSPYNPVTNPPSPYNPVTYPPSPYNPVTNPPSPYNPVTYPPYNPPTNPPSPYNPVTYPPYNPPTNPPSPYNPATYPPYNPQTNPPYNPVTNPPSPYNPVTYPPYNPATLPPYNPPTAPPAPYNPYPSFMPISTPQPQPQPQPSGACPFGYCMNGGTCAQVGGNAYMSNSFVCICSVFFTGSRCEQPMGGGVTPPPTGTPTATTTTARVTSTIQPRCNFSISLLNDGAYSARYIVEYYIDGIKQQNIISNTLAFIGQYTQVTIPYYATNVSVTLQNLGFQWNDIARDTNINTLNNCIKCYKTWNTVTDPKWDYLAC